MATTTAPRVRGIPSFREVREPDWLARIPTWASAGGLLVVLLAISAYIRTRYIGGQFWMDEAITTGIARNATPEKRKPR